MIKLGIIGYGTIATTYIKSLKHIADCYQLSGIYDINHTKLKRALPDDTYTIYDSMEAMLQSDINCVIISTPLNTHYDIAIKCIKANKHVIMEKPATLSLPEIEHLFTLAKMHHVLFYVALHASFAMDVEWYLTNQTALEPCYRIENIKKIDSHFSDPYMENGKIYTDRISLCGSYIDSGINILSVCSRIIPITNFQLKQHNVKKDTDNIVYSSDTTYVNTNKEIVMHTNWDLHLNRKRTLLSFKNAPGKILLDHSNQKVSIISDQEEHILYQETENERLVNQYIGVFKDFLSVTTIENHKKSVLKMHELLLINL